jgi:hypothetical protein
VSGGCGGSAPDANGELRVRTFEVPIDQWSVCLPDHHPGYVTWEEYLANRERLRANVRPRGEGGGAAREGGALLQGLLRCGRCGRRMQVAYSGNDGRRVRYACVRGFHLHGTEATCQTLGGGRLDNAVAAAFLEAVTPAGVAASTGAISELTDQHDARLAGQRLALERAEFEAQRAERQFDACEPENRLVARTLERKLEDALSAVAREQRTLAALEHARPAPLTPAEREALTRLARPAEAVGREDHHRPRPQRAPARADPRDRHHGPPAGEHRRGRDLLGRRSPHPTERGADPPRHEANLHL